jgi:hypothetical protein
MKMNETGKLSYESELKWQSSEWGHEWVTEDHQPQKEFLHEEG